MITALLDRLTGRSAARTELAQEEAQERAAAELLDGNLARLRRQDPDLDRIFAIGFMQVHHDQTLSTRMAGQVQAYATAKHAQGRMDLYGALFAGLEG
ncbi:hypothetical protein [Kitasatospora sp. GP82]|uniref:hypothetical protein n=1 Tax=Kitasatospora sp. GP82 TaxID=3035089 RepID=UPI0024754823|nr:hypothetical protein [Kitasatospora sp. GP82]MDH6125942.1 hypothetical protein [Kitasatospora sp. GP82]